MKFLSLFFLLFFVSCANYVNSVHRQIDREERSASRTDQPAEERSQDRYGYSNYKSRFNSANDKRPIKDPSTYSMNDGGPSSSQLKPSVKREYRPQRYKADDFKDDDSAGSLWANQGNSASLFTYQNDKHTGDMVIINVTENLRNQISAELKRMFPDKPKRTADGKIDTKAPAAGSPAAAAGAGAEEMDMKIYDKISGTVMEEVSKDYILLRGKKDVIFKKEKKTIEVQGLVSRKDIMENDYVNSDRMLDSRVFITR